MFAIDSPAVVSDWADRESVADVNADGLWTPLDSLIIANAIEMQLTVEQSPTADLNHDAVIDEADFRLGLAAVSFQTAGLMSVAQTASSANAGVCEAAEHSVETSQDQINWLMSKLASATTQEATAQIEGLIAGQESTLAGEKWGQP